jgi:hypothetical protein
MTSSPTSYTVRPLTAHEWQQYRQIRLRSLADAPQTPLAAHSPQKKIVLTMSGQHDSYWQQAQEKIAR